MSLFFACLVSCSSQTQCDHYLFLLSSNLRQDCVGVYNSLHGQYRHKVSFVHKYAHANSAKWKWGTVAGMPAVISTECSGKGVVKSHDGGLCCPECQALRKAKGGSNPRHMLINWYAKFNRCLDRRTRDELTASDLEDAEKFACNNWKKFKDDGVDLWDEANAQAEFGRDMAKLAKLLPKETYKLKANNSSPSTRAFFENVADVFEKNPDLENHLVTGLLKALVYEEVHGRKSPAIEPRVKNFY